MRLLSISCGFRPLSRFRSPPAHFEMMIYSNGLRPCSVRRAYRNDRATPCRHTCRRCDYQVLPGGTACMTDAGMTGDYDSIIGMKKEEPLHRFTTGIPSGRFEPAFGVSTLSGGAVVTDDATGRALKIAPGRAGRRLEPGRPGFWMWWPSR